MSEHWQPPRSHHWQDWSLDELIAAKAAGNHRVSVVVPARDEAQTVGEVVGRLHQDLVGSLVDELVVIDSDSSDETLAVARAAGADAHRARDIRPELGSFPGKGEAMWKAQFVTTGDLIVFIDADLVDWETHFVSALTGPLLTDPRTLLVKGYYARPMRTDTGVVAFEGGRVTELVARPLIALHFPELSGLAQPLAGEWAIRRSHLRTLSVPTGYAVELAALVDTLRAQGSEAIAQVDLGLRTHRHQSLHDLGAMGTQLMAAVERRLHPGSEPAEIVRMAQPVGDHVEVREVRVDERPPAQEIR